MSTGNIIVKQVTLSLDTSAYASGDVLADTQVISQVLGRPGGRGILHSINVLDKDNQGQPLDIVLLRSNVSLGTENATVSISDTNAEQIAGVISFASADFTAFANSKIATKTGVNLLFRGPDSSNLTDMYVAAVSRGTGTYTASGIILELGFIRD